MTLSERNSRILLVISLLGAVYGALKIVVPWMSRNVMGIIRVGKFPLEPQHFLMPMLLTTGILVFIYGVKYGLDEAFNYINESRPGIQKKYHERADRSYRFILRSIKAYLGLLTILLSGLAFLYNHSKWLLIETISGGVIILVVLFVIVLKKKNVFVSIIAKFIKVYIGIIFAWLFLFVLVFVGTLSSLTSQTPGTLQARFSTNPTRVYITFKNDCPKTMDIWIASTKSKKLTHLVVKNGDFLNSFSTEQMNGTQGAQPEWVLKNSSNTYVKTIDLAPYLTVGINHISIQFPIEEGSDSTVKIFRIDNDINIGSTTMWARSMYNIGL